MARRLWLGLLLLAAGTVVTGCARINVTPGTYRDAGYREFDGDYYDYYYHYYGYPHYYGRTHVRVETDGKKVEVDR